MRGLRLSGVVRDADCLSVSCRNCSADAGLLRAGHDPRIQRAKATRHQRLHTDQGDDAGTPKDDLSDGACLAQDARPTGDAQYGTVPAGLVSRVQVTATRAYFRPLPASGNSAWLRPSSCTGCCRATNFRRSITDGPSCAANPGRNTTPRCGFLDLGTAGLSVSHSIPPRPNVVPVFQTFPEQDPRRELYPEAAAPLPHALSAQPAWRTPLHDGRHDWNSAGLGK
jgi:hypothetical protein